MTVGELTEYLKRFDTNTAVHICYPSHDYWQTECAPEIHCAEEMEVKHSDYHNMNVLADVDCEPELDDNGAEIVDPSAKTVVVLCS